MTFVNGDLQARLMTRVRGLDPQRCLPVPVDVGKAIAVALVADHYGEIVVAPFEFALTETSFAVLSAAITRAQHRPGAGSCSEQGVPHAQWPVAGRPIRR
jgi:hypothetical protein